ncbi:MULTISPECIES: SDR family NAD(P)-dependent oxidoreductase [Microbulbifer]|uniref:SDR family NAD(P)-dependent oxidoreductase n=1 Tax=Microbulbifer TaxID=48073 RepID=UPI001E4FECF9|nr:MULTISPECIES: SDR family NAD(P)-dependent oxidoreductase [Microbulbifer]UHQ56131.1 SDR family oxidoreductase [Microbulbifer sp. YPW16]
MKLDPILDFSGRVALVTGAASGFGALLARELGARGAGLVLGDINETVLMALADELGSTGVEVRAQRCDVSREADCAALVDAAAKAFGRLDIAVNNAGVAPPMMSVEKTSEEEMDRQYNINQKGVFFGMKHQLPLMKKQQSGTVLNVSSMAGLGGAPKIASYAAAKHAVIGLTKTAAIENASHGIRVNAVCPFFTLTPMVTDIETPDGVSAQDFQAFLAAGCPMKRLAEPDEVVSAMLMLLSPKLTYVTGQALAVDGGVSAY